MRTGDLIYHRQDVDLSDPKSIQEREKFDQATFTDVDSEIKSIIEKEDPKNESIYSDNDQLKSKPADRLDLAAYKEVLMRETMDLSNDFLQQSEYQFAEYLGLTIIQKLFEQNLDSPDFIAIFASKDNTSPALGTELLKSQEIVDREVKKFNEMHTKEQTKMAERIVGEFITKLQNKERFNGRFPDTESMRTALFGQVAFKYEQECQAIYKKVSDQIIAECVEDVDNLIKNVKNENDFLQ